MRSAAEVFWDDLVAVLLDIADLLSVAVLLDIADLLSEAMTAGINPKSKATARTIYG